MKGTAKAIMEKLCCMSPRTKEANCAEIYEKIKILISPKYRRQQKTIYAEPMKALPQSFGLNWH